MRRPQLQELPAALARAGAVPAVVAELDARADAARANLLQGVLDEIPAFSASGNPEVMPQLEAHADAHLGEIRRLMAGGPPGDFAFVRAHARRRAEQKFPLEATLHAYRCGHKILSRWIRDAVTAAAPDGAGEAIVAVADFAIEYSDTVSTIATSEYVSQTRLQAEAESDRRSELLNVLLQGYDESDGRVARLLRRAGYLEQRQSFSVVVAQSVEPREMDHPARAQRLAEAVGDAVASLPVRALIGIRDNVVTAVFSDTRRLSGWTAPQTTLARRLHPLLLKVGPAAVIGVSSDAPSTSHIPKARDEARMALDFATVGERVVQFADIPVRALMLRAARDNVQAALPVWLDEFCAADERARGELSRTLRAYADADMNVLRAAKRLSVHPNTIYSRVQRIEDATGLDPLGYHALTELLLAFDCRQPRR